jgi:glycosyltransferase involved in cell wall biosynthesis
MKVHRATVLVCTYNRAPHLRQTLEAMLAMDVVPGCDVEITVVDNNSTDNTPAVVADAARDSRIRVTYLREPRQGKSFALNRGLADARGDIVALTDDDVLPSTDWLARIVADFRARDVTFVFGKVLPRWSCVPPPELLTRRAQDVWGPLAIVDYGDIPAAYVAESTGQRLPIGANLAFARTALATTGGWRTDLGKVNNTLISGEDHEIFMRLRRFGLYAGYYDPLVTVRHYVPASRLTRRYFRNWFFWHGKTAALMLDDLYPTIDMASVPSVAGVPRFLYRQAFQQSCKWLRKVGGNDALGLLIEEVRMFQFAGLFVERWRGQARNAKAWNWLTRRSSVRQARLAK